jgi:hypothetical protein
MPQDQLRNAIDVLRARLQQELEAQLTALAEQQEQAIESARRTAETTAEQRWTAKVDAVKAEWVARLESEVASARAEAEKRFVADLARLRSESERAAAEAADQARQQVEQAAARAATQARAEAEQAAADALSRVRAEAEQAAAQSAARLRSEVEQTAAQTALRVRAEAEQEIETERQKAIALLDAERERFSGELEAERQRASAALDAERQRVEAERQAERQRHESDRVSERQRFESERQHFRAERLRFEGERQQFAVERERFVSEAQARDAAPQPAERDDSELQRLEADLASERLQLEQVNEALRTANGSLRRLEIELAAERQQVVQVNEALRTANDSLRRVEASLERERQERADENARAQAAAAVVPEPDVTESRGAERDAQLAGVERLLSAMRSMDDARSLTDILNGVVDAAAAEAPRAALFIANGEYLQGMKAAGFAGVDIRSQRLPVNGGGLLSLVMARREAVATSDEPGAPAPGFAALPQGRAAIVVPIALGGDPVAVLYADDAASGEPAAPASWPEAVQILVRHAATCLAHLTSTRTAQALRHAAGAPLEDLESSAKRYARLLVSEIKLYNEAAVRVGRENRDLLYRLRPEIERARRLYKERVPAASGPHDEYFHQELVQTLADGDAALLGEPA